MWMREPEKGKMKRVSPGFILFMSCVICNEHTTYNLCVVRYHVPISDGAISSAMLLIREPEIGKMKLVLHSWVQILHHAMCNMHR